MSNSINFLTNNNFVNNNICYGIIKDKVIHYSFDECKEFIIKNPLIFNELQFTGKQFNLIILEELLELLFEWNNIDKLYIPFCYYDKSIEEEFIMKFIRNGKLNPLYLSINNSTTNYNELIFSCTNLRSIYLSFDTISSDIINVLSSNKSIEHITHWCNLNSGNYELYYELLVNNPNITTFVYYINPKYTELNKKIQDQLEINIHNKNMKNKTLQERIKLIK